MPGGYSGERVNMGCVTVGVWTSVFRWVCGIVGDVLVGDVLMEDV